MTITPHKTPEQLERNIRRAWCEACRFDGFATSTKFAVFSDDNQAAALHNRLVEHKMMLRNSVRAN